MKGLPLLSLPDVVNTTLPFFKDRGQFHATFKYQRFHFLDEVFPKERMNVQDGDFIDWTIVFRGNGSARHAGLYASRKERSQTSVVNRANAPWCFADAEAIYHDFELKANRGASRITNYIKTQYFAAYKDLAELIEKRAVLSPTDSTDTDNPRGLGWWIRMLTTGTTDYTGGFNGRLFRYADGTTTSSAHGFDSVAEPMSRNWAANHAGMGIPLCDTIRRGVIYTKFMPPRNVKEMYTGPTKKYRILTGLAYQEQYSRLVNMGPDNRNGDLSPFGTELNFMGIRWVGMPTLDDVSYNPVYCVDFGNFQPVVHSDVWLQEMDPMTDIDQPHVWVQRIDCWYNYMAANPREVGFVIHSPF